MTIPEASRCNSCRSLCKRRRSVFILDMGKPVRIYDLLRKWFLLSGHTENEIPIVEVGIPPSENLWRVACINRISFRQSSNGQNLVGKVNVMFLKWSIRKIEEFRTMQGSELKRLLSALQRNNSCWLKQIRYYPRLLLGRERIVPFCQPSWLVLRSGTKTNQDLAVPSCHGITC